MHLSNSNNYKSSKPQTQANKPIHYSGNLVMEELMSKISLRAIRINSKEENSSKICQQIPKATQKNSNKQYTCTAKSQALFQTSPKKWTNPSTTTTTVKHSLTLVTQMEGRNWSGTGGRGIGGEKKDMVPWMMNGNKQSLTLDYTLPPLKTIGSIPIKTSNSSSKLNLDNCNNPIFDPNHHFQYSNNNNNLIQERINYGRHFERPPSGNAKPTFSHYNNTRDHYWQDKNKREGRPFSASKQIMMMRERDDFHLPPIDLYQSNQNYNTSSMQKQSRPMTPSRRPTMSAFYNDIPEDESSGHVSEVIKLFENNISRENQTPRRECKIKAEQKYCETIDEETTAIFPEDDSPARIGKMRRMLQKFDQSATPYERCSSIDGLGESENGQMSTFHTYQNNFKEDFTENSIIDRSSLIRVTKFKAAKPTKKTSKSRLRNPRKDSSSEISPKSLVDKHKESSSPSPSSLPPLTGNLHESKSEQDELSHNIHNKPPWMIYSIENGSEVQPSVRNTWDSVNYQVRSKLQSVHSKNTQENGNGMYNNNNNNEDDIQME